MKWLLGILLLIGLVQSFLELKNSSSQNDDKFLPKKILPILYILAFFIGLTVMIVKEEESNYFNDLTKEISLKVYKIDSLSNEQIKKLNLNITRSQRLASRIDSIQDNTSNLLKNEKILIEQYQIVNSKLRKQIEIDYARIEENKPILELYERNINWSINADSSFNLNLCISNLGKRNAMILSGNGLIRFFDKDSKPLTELKISGNHIKSHLAPDDIKGDMFCYFSNSEKSPYNIIRLNTSFAVIKLEITFYDSVMDKKENVVFFKMWRADNNEFGGPKDWNLKLFNEWKSKN